MLFLNVSFIALDMYCTAQKIEFAEKYKAGLTISPRWYCHLFRGFITFHLFYFIKRYFSHASNLCAWNSISII